MKRFLSDSHSAQESNALLKMFRRYEETSIKRASGIVTVGPEITAFAQSLNPHTPVVSLPDLPLDSATLMDQGAVDAFRQQFKLQDKQVIVYTGNFEEYQGIDLLLESFTNFLKNARSEVRLLLVGGGNAEHPLVKKYQEICQQKQLTEHVIFAGEHAPEQMGNFFALADALISPRASGGNTPLKIYSYMQAERPILATDISSHTQVLSADCAFLGAPHSEGLAAAMAECLYATEDQKRKRIAEAKRLVEAKFNKNDFRRILQELYSTL